MCGTTARMNSHEEQHLFLINLFLVDWRFGGATGSNRMNNYIAGSLHVTLTLIHCMTSHSSNKLLSTNFRLMVRSCLRESQSIQVIKTKSTAYADRRRNIPAPGSLLLSLFPPSESMRAWESWQHSHSSSPPVSPPAPSPTATVRERSIWGLDCDRVCQACVSLASTWPPPTHHHLCLSMELVV